MKKFFALVFLISYSILRIDGNGDLNVLNTPLELCSSDPLTGFTRNGYCETNEFDQGIRLSFIK